MRMQVEKKSGLVWKGRRVPFGGEITVGTEREAKLLEAVRLASRVVDDGVAPRAFEAVLEIPSEQRGPLIERLAPITVIQPAASVSAEVALPDPAPDTREGGTPLEVLKAEPETADATAGAPADDSPDGGPMGAGQASAEAPATEVEKPRRGRKPKTAPAAEQETGTGEGVE